MQISTQKYRVANIEELVNNIYHQLCDMGHHFNLSNGAMDVVEIIKNIDSRFPTSFPCYVKITCTYEIDVDIYIEELHD